MKNFSDIKTLWKGLANTKSNTTLHHIQYCIIRAMVAKGEDKVAITKHLLHKAFAPVTSPLKLAHGREPFDVISNTLRYANHKFILGQKWEDIFTESEYEEFKNLASIFRKIKLTRRYSYFFTRQDVFEEYQLVQTAHAALELGAKLTADQVKDLHFTCVGVEDEEALVEVERLLRSMKAEYVVFREPDIGNEKTAIGVYPLEEHRRGLLRNFPLLRFKRNQPARVEEAVVEKVD